MTSQVGESSDLVAVLDRHRQQIAMAWAEKVRQLPESHYGDQPQEELRVAGMRCLDAILEMLRTGSNTALDSYLSEISLNRLRQQFDIAEVIEGLLLWRETSLPFVLQGFHPDRPETAETLVQLDGCVRYLVARFGHLYAEAVHRRLEEQRQRTVVAEERQRLARELHDSVTQSLYSINLFGEAAAELLESGSPGRAADYLRELRDTAQGALREMRLLIFELRPPLLEKEGLVGALKARLEAVEARGGLQTELQVEGEGRLPLAIEEELYRIAQEALNNVVKHARAQRVTVQLRLTEGAISLEVADDGVGFDPVAIHDRGGLGLSGMQERARRLGGRWGIESWPGRGTRVVVEMPSHQRKRPGEQGQEA